jgi:hypothetical protein
VKRSIQKDDLLYRLQTTTGTCEVPAIQETGAKLRTKETAAAGDDDFHVE